MKLLERLPRESGGEYALRTIKENIISLDLAPGSQISENELATEMGLSRTPVREALIELSKVKIVDIQPQKKSTIPLIDYDMVEESRFMRDLLECAVAELDCEMASPADLERLDENIRLQNLYLDGVNLPVPTFRPPRNAGQPSANRLCTARRRSWPPGIPRPLRR